MKGFLDRIKVDGKFRLNLGLSFWFFLATLHVFAGLQKWWTDSEMWAAVATGDLFAGKQEYFFGIKPLFHFVTWTNFQLASLLDVHPMITGRLVWGILSLVTMVICDQVLVQHNRSRKLRFLFQLLLFGTSTWLFRASEIRSDILATFIGLSLLLFSVRPRRKWYPLIVSIHILGIAFVTLKGLFIVIALLPFLISFSSRLKISRRFLIGAAFGCLVIGAVFFRTFTESFKFFLEQLENNNGIGYFSFARFEHIFRMYIQNPHLFMLHGLVFTVTIGNWKQDGLKNKFLISYVLFSVLPFLYPDPLPFYLASYLPFVYLLGLLFLSQKRFQFFTKPWVQGLTFLFLLGNFTYGVAKVINHSNHRQRLIAEWATTEFEDRNILVYDPTGVLPAENTEHWFLGPAMGDDYQNIFSLVLKKRPDIIFYTEKLMYLEPAISQLLDRFYFRWAPSVYIQVKRLSSSTELSCDKIVDESYQWLSESAVKSKTFWAISVDKEGNRSFIEDQTLVELCLASRDEDVEEVIVFATRPPQSPIEDFTRYFNYDTQF